MRARTQSEVGRESMGEMQMGGSFRPQSPNSGLEAVMSAQYLDFLDLPLTSWKQRQIR